MKNRMIGFLIVLLLLLQLCPSYVFAETGTADSGRETIRVGYFPFDGYHMEDESGVKSGYGYDILQQMRVYENWSYDYVGYEENISWDMAQDMLENGEIDMLTSATKNGERLKKFAYSKLPIGSSSTILTMRAGDNRFETTDYSNWNGLKVGILANNTRNDSFAAYAQRHGFTYVPVEFDTPDELLDALKQCELDMIVTSNLLRMENVQIIDKFDEKPFYVIVKKENTALLAAVDDALSKIEEKNPAFGDELYKTYYDPQVDGVVTYTRDEQNFIDTCNQNGVVFQALINPDRRPLSYMSEGKIQGLLVDVSQTIFDRTGLNIEIVQSESREQYVSALKEGKTSIICDFTGSTGTVENYGYVRTSSYYNSSTSMLVKREYDGTGTRCALTKSSLTNSRLANQPGVEYVWLNTMEECKAAVMDGTVDFSYGYTRTVQEMVYADVTHSLACITVSNFPIDFYMGINLQENALLTSVISKSVDSITESDISYLSEPYTYYDRQQFSLIGVMYAYPALLISIIVIVLVLIMGVILLILGRRRHERERQINEKLSVALQQAENANKAKSAFLSRISHDMRTPLNGIMGMTALMKDKATSEDSLQDLNQLQLSGQYLLNLINDTLDVSKIESGKLELHPVVCDGREILENIIALAQPNLQSKRIQFKCKIDDLPNEMVYIDVGRVEQVVMNILSNAIKFTPEEGSIDFFMTNIANENGVITDRLVIKDSGIGMSEAFLPHLFEPFSQEDSGRTSSFKGTGLGMSITHEIVQMMGGTIEVTSEVGKGTTFSVTLPMPVATDSQIAVSHKSTEAILDNTALQGKRVLLCEDHPLNAAIAKRLLEKAGMIVEHAENGQIGTEMFAQSPVGYYNIILMDIRMPAMDGLETTRMIRQMPRVDAARVPIVALTANAFDEDVRQAEEAGMNAHLGKPIEVEKLFAVFNEFLQ